MNEFLPAVTLAEAMKLLKDHFPEPDAIKVALADAAGYAVAQISGARKRCLPLTAARLTVTR